MRSNPYSWSGFADSFVSSTYWSLLISPVGPSLFVFIVLTTSYIKIFPRVFCFCTYCYCAFSRASYCNDPCVRVARCHVVIFCVVTCFYFFIIVYSVLSHCFLWLYVLFIASCPNSSDISFRPAHASYIRSFALHQSGICLYCHCLHLSLRLGWSLRLAPMLCGRSI